MLFVHDNRVTGVPFRTLFSLTTQGASLGPEHDVNQSITLLMCRVDVAYIYVN